MASSLLSPDAIPTDPRHRSASNADTAVSTNHEASLLKPNVTTAVPSLVDEPTKSALQPDPGTEADFHVENNPFAFSPGQLNKLLNPKSHAAFRALGGLQGISRGLHTDPSVGISVDETSIASSITFEEAVRPLKELAPSPPSHAAPKATNSEPHAERVRVFKRNVLPSKKSNHIWKLMWIAFNEKVLILLTVAGVISLALGLYETLGVEKKPGEPPSVDWVEGVSICAAVIIVVLVGSHNDWQKEKAFIKLNTKKDDREIKVLRSGKLMMINIKDILVGDVLSIEPGDLVSVDGVFIDGHSVKCDESSATGEFDALKKTGGDQVLELLESGHSDSKDLDPFIISGSRVLEGMNPPLPVLAGGV